MMPVITEKGGIVKYQDLIEGQTLNEQIDEATGIAQKVVTEYRANRTKEDLRPRITLLDEDSGEAARYMLSPGASFWQMMDPGMKSSASVEKSWVSRSISSSASSWNSRKSLRLVMELISPSCS